MESTIVSLPDQRIKVYRAGLRTKGVPLLFFHGFLGSGADFSVLFPFFQDRHPCFAPDLFGHGASALPDDFSSYTVGRFVQDMSYICDALGVSQVVLIGYSMGGRMAISFACQQPSRVARLILESTTPGLADIGEREARRQHDEVLANHVLKDGIAAFVNDWERQPLFASQSTLAGDSFLRQRNTRLSQQKEGIAAHLLRLGTGSQPSYWEVIGDLPMPVTLITGQLDEKFTRISTSMAARIRNVRRVVVPGVGHNVHLENPATFVKQLWYDVDGGE